HDRPPPPVILYRIEQGGYVMRSTAASVVVVLMTTIAAAQPPSSKPAAKPVPRPAGTLAQVMRGIYFPNSNLIFDVQQNDPSAPKKKSEATGSSTDTYSGAYAGWEIVENAAVALTDGVDLILQPGRTCQNGKPVPVAQ